MSTFDTALDLLATSVQHTDPASGNCFAVIGPTGAGKSLLLNSVVERSHEQPLLVRFTGIDAPTPALAPIYEGLFEAVTAHQMLTAFGQRLIRKYVKLIPGFGQYLDPIVSGLRYVSAAEALRRAGLTLSSSPATHIAGFVDEAAAGRLVYIACDDAQWLDDESWFCISRLSESARARPWTMALAYCNDAAPKKTDRLAQLARWRTRATATPWTVIGLQPWTRDSLPGLCSRLLGSQCVMTDEQYDDLYRVTEGLPLYVKSALSVLLAQNRIVVDSYGVYRAQQRLLEPEIEERLRRGLIDRVRTTYAQVREGRATLEVASVLGNPFCDEAISQVSEVERPFEVLSRVEDVGSLVRYVMEHRRWWFSHSQIRKVIYESLGSHAATLHMAIANWLAMQADAHSGTIAFHYECAGDISKAVEYHTKELSTVLRNGQFGSAHMLAEHLLATALDHADLFDAESLLRIRVARAQSLYGQSCFRDALAEFDRIRSEAVGTTSYIDAVRWLGRCYLKLDSQDDFAKAIGHLTNATQLYGEASDASAQADAYTDLVVAYAHANRFADAEEAFRQAESLYNRIGDRLGMARLQRRNVIFMVTDLALPIQRRLAQTFQELEIPHERIMALNNTATLHLYRGELDEAERVLTDALTDSVELGDFGASYLYGNLAIVHTVRENAVAATEAIQRARRYSSRGVLDIIVDITESVLIAATSGAADGLPYMERVLTRALQVGEYAYIQPCSVNLGLALLGVGEAERAREVLQSFTVEAGCSFSEYKHGRWFDALEHAYQIVGDDAGLNRIDHEFGWAHSERDTALDTFEYAVVPTQFWSD